MTTRQSFRAEDRCQHDIPSTTCPARHGNEIVHRPDEPFTIRFDNLSHDELQLGFAVLGLSTLCSQAYHDSVENASDCHDHFTIVGSGIWSRTCLITLSPSYEREMEERDRVVLDEEEMIRFYHYTKD